MGSLLVKDDFWVYVRPMPDGKYPGMVYLSFAVAVIPEIIKPESKLTP